MPTAWRSLIGMTRRIESLTASICLIIKINTAARQNGVRRGGIVPMFLIPRHYG